MQKTNIVEAFLRKREHPSKKEKKVRSVCSLVLIDIIVWLVVFTSLPTSEPLVFENRALASNLKPESIVVEESLSQSDVIKKVASEEGIDWKILYGIFLKETQGNCTRIGDTHLSKASVGCYQISRIYHPEVTDEQAMDLEWSSHWTAKRLKSKAEKFGMDNAIAMHNGNPKLPQVQKYLQDVKENISKL